MALYVNIFPVLTVPRNVLAEQKLYELLLRWERKLHRQKWEKMGQRRKRLVI